jgi:DNA-binding TFAR19-related protein (PDSD5 family)
MFMDLGGPGENIAPDEGGGGGEALSEEARARFAGAAAAQQQAKKEEKKAKKRDDGVAQMIMRFLSDNQRIHLATLISRLVAIDCPSPFLLAILSLVNPDCAKAVEEYLAEQGSSPDIDAKSLATIGDTTALSAEANASLEKWILSMELVLASDPQRILKALIVDEGNIDGTVLQLTTFVLEEFLKGHGKAVAFPDLQRVSISILQAVFESYMHHAPLPSGQKTEDDE